MRAAEKKKALIVKRVIMHPVFVLGLLALIFFSCWSSRSGMLALSAEEEKLKSRE
jgi:hypothetical protein